MISQYKLRQSYISLLLRMGCIAIGCWALLGCGKPAVKICHSAAPVVCKEHDIAKLRAQYIHILRAQGIGVFYVGETRTIVIPSALVFRTSTTVNLANCQKDVLEMVAKYIGTYDVTRVEVSVYTDPQPLIYNLPPLPLTQRQAEVVERELWRYNMDVRMIDAHGYGEHQPVICPTAKNASLYNRRVEISFQVYPPERMY